MTPLQEKLLEMLKWFHEYCKENNLSYYLLGGTMLGAARHKGFIPWDDDIDVGMMREDYERFLKLMYGKIEAQKYVVEGTDSEKKDYCYPYAKVYDTTTTLIENYAIPLKRGVFIDVFPLDYLGDDFEECKKRYKPIKQLYNFYLTRVASVDPHRVWYKNLAIKVARMIPGMDNRKLRMKLDKKCTQYNIKTQKWGGNFLGNWGIKEIMPMSILGKPSEYTFEGITVYGAEKYDQYLTCLYGDWRKLPPKEKQITHHDYLLLVLTESYLE